MCFLKWSAKIPIIFVKPNTGKFDFGLLCIAFTLDWFGNSHLKTVVIFQTFGQFKQATLHANAG